MGTSYETTSRGFKHYEPIVTDYGHKVLVYESSAAMEPCLWLAVDGRDTQNSDDGELHVHLTLDQARAIQDALSAAIANHYQGDDASPATTEPRETP